MTKKLNEVEEVKADLVIEGPLDGPPTIEEEEVETVNFPAFINDKPIVKLSDLQIGHVVVQDDKGNFLYLAPTHDRNEYLLRPVPR